MNNIILIGMPGSGKSTSGVVLAKTLGYSFEDTDLVISKNAGKKLQQILDNDGVEAFLRLEETVGKTICCSNTVIATGGSMVLCHEAMEHLKSIGTIVYLEVPFNELKRRIKNFKTRGIVFKNGETFTELYNTRTKLYEKYADIIIKFTDNNLEGTIEKIVNQLNK